MESGFETRNVKIEDQCFEIPMRNGKYFHEVLEDKLRASNTQVDVARIENQEAHILRKKDAQIHYRTYNIETGKIIKDWNFREKEPLGEDLTPGIIAFMLIGTGYGYGAIFYHCNFMTKIEKANISPSRTGA